MRPQVPPADDGPRYTWASFDSGGQGFIADFLCPWCGSFASSGAVRMDAEIPEVRCLCGSCSAEWRLLLTHLQALRLLVDPDVGDFLVWDSCGKARAWTLGFSAARGLWQLSGAGDDRSPEERPSPPAD
jgi:hypothetical protein